MDNFLKEILDICNLPFGEVTKNFKVIWAGSKALYICNYKKLLDYTTSHIALSVSSGVLDIEGESLILKQINKGEVVICGEIASIALGGARGKKSKE